MNKPLFTLLASCLLISTLGCSPGALSDILGNAQPGGKPTAAPTSNPQPSASASMLASTPSAPAADFAGFKARFQQQATSPRGAAQMLFEALVAGLEQRANAESYLTLVLRSDELSTADSSPTGYILGATGKFMLQQLQAKPEIVYSYLGGTPGMAYKNWNKTGWKLSIPTQGSTAGQIVVDNTAEKPGAVTGRVYVVSAGKDTPTPINMDLNKDGLWKIQTSSLGNLATGVKASGSAGDF